MPIPSRRAGESRDEFIGRCIADLSNEYPNEQAAAICYSQLHQTFVNEKGGQRYPLDIISHEYSQYINKSKSK